jgi:hypothetical protein
MQNRWYDPQTMRFISRDPLGFGGGDLNLYRYCGNNPLSNLDPTGLDDASYGNGDGTCSQGSPDSESNSDGTTEVSVGAAGQWTAIAMPSFDSAGQAPGYSGSEAPSGLNSNGGSEFNSPGQMQGGSCPSGAGDPRNYSLAHPDYFMGQVSGPLGISVEFGYDKNGQLYVGGGAGKSKGASGFKSFGFSWVAGYLIEGTTNPSQFLPGPSAGYGGGMVIGAGASTNASGTAVEFGAFTPGFSSGGTVLTPVFSPQGWLGWQ